MGLMAVGIIFNPPHTLCTITHQNLLKFTTNLKPFTHLLTLPVTIQVMYLRRTCMVWGIIWIDEIRLWTTQHRVGQR